MSWEHPALLWFLILPVAGLLWILFRPERTAGETQWPKIQRLKSGMGGLKPAPVRTAVRVRPVLIWLALMLVITALARPQWGETEEQVYERAREVLIALDLSRSMLVDDVAPSRLDRSKLMIQSLLDQLEGERVGLIVFAGTAFLQSPLSSDYQVLRGFLAELDPDYLPQGGTDYEAMLKTALNSFGQEKGPADRFLIVLSDGESPDGDWKPQAEILRERSIQVLGLGIGTAEGGLVPDGRGGFMKDAGGAVVLSRLNDATLRELTEMTRGVYRPASGWIDLADLISATIDKGRAGQFLEERTIRRIERFQLFLLPAILLAFLSLWRELPSLPRFRRLQRASDRQRKRQASAASAAVLAPVLITLLFLAPRLPAQSLVAPEPPSPEAIKELVTRLIDQHAATADDWLALATETLTFGQAVQQAGQPIPKGAVEDAIEAVDQGATMDPETADWEQLRTDLLKLLEEPPPQDQQQDKDEQKKDDQQDQENQDKQQSQDSQDDQQSQNDQQNQSEDQKQQSGDQDQSSDPQQNKEQQDQDKSSSEENEQKEEQKAENQPKPGEEDDKTGEEEQPADPAKEDDSQMQSIGGESSQAELPDDPKLAAALQELEQVRNQDSPARLFQILEGEPNTESKTKKDW